MSNKLYKFKVTLWPNNQPWIELGIYEAKNHTQAKLLAIEENELEDKDFEYLSAEKVK
jgi:hypothetical protein